MKQNTAMKNLNKVFELFRLHSEYFHSGSEIPEAMIIKAEDALNVVLPPSYRNFIKKYGTAQFFGSEYYGISNAALRNGGDFESVKRIPDAIWYTLTERKQFQLPKKYIIVGAPGYGPLDAIDTSKPDEHGECPVVMIAINDEDPVTKEKEWYEMEQMAPDFGTYLYNQSKAALQNSIDSGEVEA